MFTLALCDMPQIEIVFVPLKYGLAISIQLKQERAPTDCWVDSDFVEIKDDNSVVVYHSEQLLFVVQQISNNMLYIIDYFCGEDDENESGES